MDEGFPEGRRALNETPDYERSALAPEPVACAERSGPTPIHPEPGRETL